MPRPLELMHACEDFEKFLSDARDRAGLETRNQTYTMVQGVLQTFRKRLNLKDAIRFANVLPPLLRAIFVADWDTDAPTIPYSSLADMTTEVQQLRRHHNWAPDSCISDVARALRNAVNEEDLDRILEKLPAGAKEFWRC